MSLNRSPAGPFRLTAHPSCNLNASLCLFQLGGSIYNKSSSNTALYANTGWLRWWMRQRVTLAAFVDVKCNSEAKKDLDSGSVNILNKQSEVTFDPAALVTLCVHGNQTLPVCCSCLTLRCKAFSSSPLFFCIFFPKSQMFILQTKLYLDDKMKLASHTVIQKASNYRHNGAVSDHCLRSGQCHCRSLTA